MDPALMSPGRAQEASQPRPEVKVGFLEKVMSELELKRINEYTRPTMRMCANVMRRKSRMCA